MKMRVGLCVVLAAVMGACASAPQHAFPASGVLVPTATRVLAAEKPVSARTALSDAEREALQQAAKDVLDADPRKAREAALTLRGAGQEGLDALLAAYAAEVSQWVSRTPTDRAVARAVGGNAGAQEQLAALTGVVDEVAMQKDAAYSRLYWYTDLHDAQAEALRTGKPILSLRLLGKLNEDLSCANSRFFRTTLYPNARISAYLRDHYVLHWESVRPAPVITIDMGDGRKIVRTVTGNSIHYVLDAQGRVVDAIPGLYGANAFLAALTRDYEPAVAAGKMNAAEYVKAEKQFAAAQVAQIDAGLHADFAKLAWPDWTAEALSDAQWKQIAELHAADVAFDPTATALIQQKMAGAPAAVAAKIAMPLAISKSFVERPMVVNALQNLMDTVSLDTVKNEYEFRRTICLWLSLAGNVPVSLKPFNDRVYADVFKTPSTDPWLGLAPADVFSAVDENGLVTTGVTASR